MSASKTNPEPDENPDRAPDPKNKQGPEHQGEQAREEYSPPGSDAALASLREQLEAALAERDELRNKWLKAEAELDNYRKRVQREAEEFRRYQVLPLARDLLPGLDNLGRAIRAAESSQSIDDLLQGLTMVARQLEDILNQHAVQPIEAVGRPFDPNLHEALQQVPSKDHPPMSVVEELEKGYTMHDRVVRASKVIVSSGPPESQTDESAENPPEG